MSEGNGSRDECIFYFFTCLKLVLNASHRHVHCCVTVQRGIHVLLGM